MASRVSSDQLSPILDVHICPVQNCSLTLQQEGCEIWVRSEDPLQVALPVWGSAQLEMEELDSISGADFMDLIETVDDPLNSNILNACGSADLNL